MCVLLFFFVVAFVQSAVLFERAMAVAHPDLPYHAAAKAAAASGAWRRARDVFFVGAAAHAAAHPATHAGAQVAAHSAAAAAAHPTASGHWRRARARVGVFFADTAPPWRAASASVLGRPRC